VSAALERQHRLSRATMLRHVLSDGRWHTSTELALRVGHRFGGALRIVRLGDDGEPAWLVEREQVETDGSIHRYRYVGVNPDPPKAGGTWRARALAAEKRCAELEAAVRALRESAPRQRGLFQ
jgi:hypothetical protein